MKRTSRVFGSAARVVLPVGCVFLVVAVLVGPGAAGAARAEVAELVEEVAPAVVSVRVRSEAARAPDALPGYGPLFRNRGGGAFEGIAEAAGVADPAEVTMSGFLVAPEGRVVTLWLQLPEPVTYEVTLQDGSRHEARVLVVDRRSGMCLLKIDGEGYPAVELAEAEARLGESVVCVYVAQGRDTAIARGIVAVRDRQLGNRPLSLLQTDMATDAGSAGAPVFSDQGRVAGVAYGFDTDRSSATSVTYVIPVDYLRPMLDRAREDERVVLERGMLGVVLEAADAPLAGAVVLRVLPDSPAADPLFGLAPGDRITAVEGRRVRDARDLPLHIGRYAAGDEVELTYVRGDEPARTVTVTLAAPPPAAAEPRSEAEAAPQPPAIAPPVGRRPAPRGDARQPRLRIAGPDGDEVIVLDQVPERLEGALGQLLQQLGGDAARANLNVVGVATRQDLQELSEEIQELRTQVAEVLDELQQLHHLLRDAAAAADR